jgi:hypothetical protein
VKFVSRCIAEGSTDNDSGDIPDLEAEYEGTVTGLPWDKKRQPAVFSVVGHLDDNGPGEHRAGLDLLREQGELNFTTNSGKATGKISADDIHAGRWGFPDGFDDTNCPDASAYDRRVLEQTR